MSNEKNHEHVPAPAAGEGFAVPERIGRRTFLRGVSLTAAGGLTAGALLPMAHPLPARAADQVAAPLAADAAAQLDAQTRRILRWQGAAPANWVRVRPGIDHDVLIVGGGQSGLAIGYALRRKGVGRVEIVDQADPGQAGIWKTIARMKQLRTAKTISGPEHGNAALGFRAWYETLHGPGAFDALDRIPRVEWGDYIKWFEQVTDAKVSYRTKVVDIEPQGELLRVQLESGGTRRSVTVRKLVLANGYAGAGGPSIPGFVRALPQQAWAHSSSPIRFDQLAGKSVAIIGAGASGFDAAGTALEAGATEVHLFSRDPYLNYTNAPSPTAAAAPATERGHAAVTELQDELPDTVRWRNFLIRDRRIASVPYDSVQRAVSHPNFYAYIKSEWTAATVDKGKVVGTIAGKTRSFDYLIVGTGYRIDLALQPQLAKIQGDIARWEDRYKPEKGEESKAGNAHPYLGTAFEFQPRDARKGAAYLRNIHCFNLAANVSFGIPVGDVPSTVHQPGLVAAIESDLFLADLDVEAHKRFALTPEPAPDAAPYQKALRTI